MKLPTEALRWAGALKCPRCGLLASAVHVEPMSDRFVMVAYLPRCTHGPVQYSLLDLVEFRSLAAAVKMYAE